MLELHVDTRELAAIARPLSAMRGQLEKAVQAAVRRTGVTLRTDVIRQTAQVTYLQRAKITTAVFKPLVRTTASEIRAEIGVRGKPFGMDAFRLIPKRVTARRGRRSRDWPLSGYSTGPGEGDVLGNLRIRRGGLAVPDADVTAGSVSLIGHRHTGVDTGSGTSGGPLGGA